MRRLAPLLLVALPLACGGVSPPADLSERDGGPGAPTRDGGADPVTADAGATDSGATDAGATDTGPRDAGAPGLDFSAVDERVRSALTAAGGGDMGLAIYDDDDQLVFQQMYGDFAPDRRVAVASASKMVAAAVLFEVVDRGLLSLESTTGDVLGWTGANATITLEHLLSFTSGLEREHACTSRPGLTLEACVDQIRDAAVVAPPGERFDYGSTHLHVAARMAEVVTGQTWNDLFRGVLGDPLGLPAEVLYYTAPRQAFGTTNPLVAGGLRTTMDEYAALLAVVYHRGRHRDLEVGAPAAYDAQTVEPFPSVVIGNSPMAAAGLPFRYGLGAWLECGTPATGCTTISSPGAFGWTPWLDREGGYYAIIGTEGSAGPGVVVFSVTLAQTLKPLILDALAAGR